VLADFSALVADAAQSDDLLYRLGGDEFLVLRRHATAAALGGWLHDVRHQARGDLHVSPAGDSRVAFSCGVVAVAGEDLSQTLERVDKALYAAKEAGRDTIVVID
jgi:diguanylate cyclase (GGDEF)-like protein